VHNLVEMIARFLLALGVTAALVLFTAWLGRLGRRRAHLAAAAVAVTAFGYTVFAAEQLGRVLEFPRLTLGVHLVFANLGLLALVGVIATGTRLFLREEASRRRWHRRLIGAFLTLLTLATATGTWMLLHSTPLGEAAAG
jgi:hypothetical protein